MTAESEPKRSWKYFTCSSLTLANLESLWRCGYDSEVNLMDCADAVGPLTPPCSSG